MLVDPLGGASVSSICVGSKFRGSVSRVVARTMPPMAVLALAAMTAAREVAQHIFEEARCVVSVMAQTRNVGGGHVFETLKLLQGQGFLFGLGAVSRLP